MYQNEHPLPKRAGPRGDREDTSIEGIHEHLSDWDGECASYTEISGELYWVSTGRFWVVDVPAQEEKGHWGYK